MADFPSAYQITAVTLMVMGNSKNLSVFNFVIPLRSRKFDAREIYTHFTVVFTGDLGPVALVIFCFIRV